MAEEPKDRRPGGEPTTDEALPGVELGADEETEETARETMGPDAAEEVERELRDTPGEGS